MISLNYTYCPICFNNSLTLKPTGKISILLNGKPSSHGQILYNLNSQAGHEIKKEFLVKMEEYFRWYGDLSNAESVSKIDVVSTDFVCDHGCSIPATTKPSVIGILFTEKFIKETAVDLASKYHVELSL